MNKAFKEINYRFGFGCMRFPLLENGDVDIEEVERMVDYFIASGFNYFDTAHMYVGGRSEIVLKETLTSRYARDKYLLTNKLSSSYFETEEEIRPLFNLQLDLCGVDYFDFYLMHAQNAAVFEKYKKCHAYEIALELKKEGKIKHFGLSFHDKASVLDQILTEYPQVEFVQIQFNYLDYDNPRVESKKCFDVCVKHHKPIIVMEPVKGGRLVNLSPKAAAVLDGFNNGSYASYALRYCASFDEIFMILSGMSNMAQMIDNVSVMKDVKPLSKQEFRAIDEVVKYLKEENTIPCTACGYCLEGCPKKILIPELFSLYNSHKLFNEWGTKRKYNEYYLPMGSVASACIKCGKCEKICPQHLKVRDYLEVVGKEFE